MDFKIRQARPDDASFLAWVMLTAGRSHLEKGIWDIIIGRPESECLTFLEHLTVTAEPHMLHYSIFIVIEADGHPVAALSGYDPVTLGEETVAPHWPVVMEMMGLTEEDMAAGQQGVAACLTCYPEPHEGAWIVESVATLPEYRGRGLIGALIGEILEEGRRRGFGLAQVSFLIDNTLAERAYQKAGFRIHDEKRHADFKAVLGCPGMARMLREL
jgi:GNAT superfamily N-acetyltransferase